MERLPNGNGKTTSQMVVRVRAGQVRFPLRDKAFGCIAQLVEQLTLKHPLFQRFQQLPAQTSQKPPTAIQWLSGIFPNAREAF